ncbi:hypothetical protein ACFQDE_09675 [Deinococcus caeni]|uniref:hypothetical protein n=1 Tax=Deinococcus caeni TaxID=569127 RepID=UPI0036231B5E
MTDLRPFTPADADAFAALQLAALGRAGSGEDLLAADARRPPTDLLRRQLLVAADGEVLGARSFRPGPSRHPASCTRS